MLSPVHDMIFLILRGVPQDGTFDQLRPLRNHTRFKYAASLDLKAATDRLWIEIQIWLITELTGSETFARNWAKILVGIEYSLRNMAYGLNVVVKYAVGQPMGALSSWPSLALTHHFLVQAAAWKAGKVPVGTWFTDYAILGDDIVIFDKDVADEYKRLISHIGMTIGLHKSVLSNDGTVVEFAKRIFHHGFDVSPAPLKEFFAALFGYGNLLDYGRKYNLSFVQLARVLGFKYRALSKVGNGFKPLPAGLKRLYVASSLPGTSSEVSNFFALGAPIKAKWPISLESFWRQFSQLEFKALLKAIDKRIKTALDDRGQFFNLGDLRANNNLIESLSGRLKSPIVPWDSSNWASPGSVNPKYSDFIPGPAENKEQWLGFIMANTPGLLMPIDVTFSLKGYRAAVEALSATQAPKVLDATGYKLIQAAFAAYFDAQVLPKRDALRQSGVVVQTALAKAYVLPEDMNQVFINFLAISREAALVPQEVVALQRSTSVARSIDPVALRMWRRWSKLIQGTVHGGKIIS
jgi:hypothetical protein